MTENTAQMLIKIGTYLQFVFWMIGIGLLILNLLIFLPLIIDPVSGTLALFAFLVSAIYYVIMTIISVIFMLLWLRWYKQPEAHKRNLIITGILGLIFAGVVPGLLVLLGAFMLKV